MSDAAGGSVLADLDRTGRAGNDGVFDRRLGGGGGAFFPAIPALKLPDRDLVLTSELGVDPVAPPLEAVNKPCS